MKAKKKLSICFVIWNTKKCGGVKIILELANRLLVCGYQVKILAIAGNRLTWFPLKIKIDPFFNFRWITCKYDILVATFWPTAYFSLLLRAKKKLYFVQGWETDFYPHPLIRYLVFSTLKLPYIIFTISNFLHKKISAASSRKLYILPCTIDRFLFHPLQGGKSHKAKKGKRILSVVSSYDIFKGLPDLIWIARLLKEKHPSWKFILISFEKNPPAKVFDEFISDPSPSILAREYQRADVFLQTSKVEGFPLPPLEAMSCGCPGVLTDSGGVKEYARNNYNCLLAKNAEEIVRKKMVERIVENQRFREKLAKNGLETAKKFSWDKTINFWEKYLRKIYK